MNRDLHRVTCKVALYDRPKQLILLVEYAENVFGLPGGHLKYNEGIESSLRRELYEELGIKYNHSLTRKDFWLHHDGKVILGFVGDLDSSTNLNIDDKEIISAKWFDIDDIENGKINIKSYDRFIIENGKKILYPSTVYRVSVKALIKDNQGRVLIVEEKDKWDLPGGGLDHGEDAVAGIKRELFEELGVVDVNVKNPVCVKTFYLENKQAWLMWIVYEVELNKTNFAFGDLVTDARYVEPESLTNSDDVFQKMVYEVVAESAE